MANNPILFDAVIAGATGGTSERWLTSAVSTNYTSAANAINAFATEVDSLIPTIGNGATQAQADLLQSLVQGVLADRYLTSITASSYLEIASAIAAAFQAMLLKVLPVPNQFETQTTWFIATTGDDTNDGLTLATAIRTTAELCRRLIGANISQDVTVTIGAGSFGVLNLNLVLNGGILFKVLGDVTNSASIAITANTPQNPATATRGSITIGAGAFTLYDRLVLTSGAQVGAINYVTKVTGLTANVTRWAKYNTDQYFGKNVTFVNPANGDTYAAQTLNTTLQRMDINIVGGGRLAIRDCKLIVDDFVPFNIIHNDFNDSNSGVIFMGCAFSQPTQGFYGFQFSNFTAVLCKYSNQCFIEQSQAEIFGGIFTSGTGGMIFARTSYGIMSQGIAFIGNSGGLSGYITCTQNSILQMIGGASLGDISWFDGTTLSAMEIAKGSIVTANSGTRLWGLSGAFNPSFLIRNNAWLTYITIPSLTGGTNDANIGGTNKAYAAVPYIETLKNCGMILGTV